MRQAALTWYHQGRVLSACWANLANIEQEPPLLINITIRAMYLTIRSIDSVRVERKQDLPKEEERLLARLREKKNAVVDLRFALTKFYLPAGLHHGTVKIDNSGMISVMRKGEYSGWGRLFL